MVLESAAALVAGKVSVSVRYWEWEMAELTEGM